MDRPLKFSASHPTALFAASQMRLLGYSIEWHPGRQDWLITSNEVASLERNIVKAIRTIASKLAFKGLHAESERVRKVLIDMENR